MFLYSPVLLFLIINTVPTKSANLKLTSDFLNLNSTNESLVVTDDMDGMFINQIMHFDKMARELPVVMVATDEEMDEMEREEENRIKRKRDMDKKINKDKKSKNKLGPAMTGLVSQRVPFIRLSDLARLPTNRYQCMDIFCICVYLRGYFAKNKCTLKNGRIFQKIVRKEIRMMTENELIKFRTAMWSVQPTVFKELSSIHGSIEKAPGAHSGPAFLPFHREFLKRMEIAIRSVDETVFLPYWDSRLDSGLADPRGSALFSDDLLGETNSRNEVRNGMFKGWKSHLSTITTRNIGNRKSSLISWRSIDKIMKEFNGIHEMLAATAARPSCNQKSSKAVLELLHGNNHIYVGGDMGQTLRSTNDVLFFLLHSFVDKTWEEWRQKKQSRHARSFSYPADSLSCSAMSHWSRSIMTPFSPFTNKMGISNKYTDNLYSYAPTPTCSKTNKDCGSKFLFCDTHRWVCVARMRTGFKCKTSIYGGADPCYKSICVRGVCTSRSKQSNNKWKPIQMRKTPVVSEESCFNSNECCSSWASKGFCQSREAPKMALICAASCGLCKPKYTLMDECSDRHALCAHFSRKGECSKNFKWMNENCRRTCGKCAKSKKEACLNQTINI